jgi:hypothetical protein
MDESQMDVCVMEGWMEDGYVSYVRDVLINDIWTVYKWVNTP